LAVDHLEQHKRKHGDDADVDAGLLTNLIESMRSKVNIRMR